MTHFPPLQVVSLETTHIVIASGWVEDVMEIVMVRSNVKSAGSKYHIGQSLAGGQDCKFLCQ
jgi:hypothetical protein